MPDWLMMLCLWLAACPLGFMFTPACCCCVWATDNFGRAALGAAWSAVAGSWAISVGALQTTSSDGILLHVAESPVASEISLSVRAAGTASNDEVRLLLDYLDTDNYKFAQLIIGTSKTLKIFKRVAGVNTELASVASTTSTSSFVTLKFCQLDGKLFASTPSANVSATEASNSNLKVAIATGTLTGTASFDDFSASRTDGACPGCWPCSGCTAGFGPGQLQVTMTGITSGGACAAGNCEDYNATFIVDQYFFAVDECHYEYEFQKCGGAVKGVFVRIRPTAIVRAGIKTALGDGDASDELVRFEDFSGASVDCTTFSGANLANDASFDNNCLSDAPTWTVSLTSL